MSNLSPTAGWDSVPQLETSTVAAGGPGGPMNAQAQALLNRTEKLASDIAALGGGSAVDPALLNFSKAATVPYASFMPAALTILTEPFTADSGQFTRTTDSTLDDTFSVASGRITIANTSGSIRSDFVTTGADITIPQLAVQIDIVSKTSTASGWDFVSCGLIKDSDNFVIANWERVSGQFRVQVKVGGASTIGVSVSSDGIAAPFTLGLGIVGNTACVYVDSGSGFVFKCGYDFSGQINLKAASLVGWKPGFAVASSSNTSATLDNFKAGRFGGFGIRDISAVTNEDGTPYLSGGNAYIVATCSGGIGIGSCYQAVLALNLTTYELTQGAVLMVARNGAVHPDHAGHIVRKSDGTFVVAMSSWGNGFGGDVSIWVGTSASNLLSGSYAIATLAKITLDTQLAGYAVYDPFLVLDGSTWRLAYVVSPGLVSAPNTFYPAVATSPDRVTWTNDGDDAGTVLYEGSKFISVSGVLFITVATRNMVRLYDKHMNFRGVVRVTTNGKSLTQPHMMIFWTGAKYIALSFDATRPAGVTSNESWGQMIVHEAN